MLINSYIIRKVRPADNLALAEMIRGVFEEHDAPKIGTVYSDPSTYHLAELFDVPKAVLWVAERNGEILGSCGVFPTEGLADGTTELVKYYLPASARGQGIGRELLIKSLASASHLGYKRIYLESLPHYAKAVHIYEKLGFRHINEPMGNSGHTTCNIWMIKDII